MKTPTSRHDRIGHGARTNTELERRHPGRFRLGRLGVALSCCLSIASPLALATERDLGAHEHGAASLDVAIDGERLYIDLEGPADNVLGFEHAPNTDEQRATVAEAERLLGSADLFAPSAAAGCTLESAMVDIALPEPGEESGHDDHGSDDMDADGEEHHGEHDGEEHHDEHDADAEGHGEEHHGEHDGEEHHDEHAEGEVHSEMSASHVFVCDDPGALDAMGTALFDRFEGFEEIAVQLIGPGGQDGARLTGSDANVSLETVR